MKSNNITNFSNCIRLIAQQRVNMCVSAAIRRETKTITTVRNQQVPSQKNISNTNTALCMVTTAPVTLEAALRVSP